MTSRTLGTDPVHHLAASCCDFVRIKTCALIPLKIKLHHCRVPAQCQAWLLVDIIFFGALWTPTPVDDFSIYLGLPAVTTRWAEPVPACVTVCHNLVCSQPILGCVPVGYHSWGHGQQSVVLTQTVVSAKRALTVPILPVADSGQPFVQKPTRTLVTTPPHTQTAAGCDVPVSQELTFGMMPLPLQLWPQQADV